MVTVSVLSILLLCISFINSSEKSEKIPLARIRSKSINDLTLEEAAASLFLNDPKNENPRKLKKRAKSHLPRVNSSKKSPDPIKNLYAENNRIQGNLILGHMENKSPEQLRSSQDSPKLNAKIIDLNSSES